MTPAWQPTKGNHKRESQEGAMELNLHCKAAGPCCEGYASYIGLPLPALLVVLPSVKAVMPRTARSTHITWWHGHGRMSLIQAVGHRQKHKLANMSGLLTAGLTWVATSCSQTSACLQSDPA